MKTVVKTVVFATAVMRRLVVRKEEEVRAKGELINARIMPRQII
jgi:hypothetical protein